MYMRDLAHFHTWASLRNWSVRQLMSSFNQGQHSGLFCWIISRTFSAATIWVKLSQRRQINSTPKLWKSVILSNCSSYFEHLKHYFNVYSHFLLVVFTKHILICSIKHVNNLHDISFTCLLWVPQAKKARQDSFFSLTETLTTCVHQWVWGLLPRQALTNLQQQLRSASSTMEAWNLVHFD